MPRPSSWDLPILVVGSARSMTRAPAGGVTISGT